MRIEELEIGTVVHYCRGEILVSGEVVAKGPTYVTLMRLGVLRPIADDFHTTVPSKVLPGPWRWKPGRSYFEELVAFERELGVSK